jgi:hypothetical protein
MNSAASLGPVQLAGLTYFVSGVVSFGVAGIIKLLFGLIKFQKNRGLVKVTIVDEVSVKTKSPL